MGGDAEVEVNLTDTFERTLGIQRDLGAALRGARSRSGHTQIAVSIETGIHQSRLSRIERGDVSPRDDEIDLLLRAIAATDDERRRIRGLLDDLDTGGVYWYLSDTQATQSALALQHGLWDGYRSAKHIDWFAVTLMPGLLQTQQYAESLLEQVFGTLFQTKQDVNAASLERMRNQEMLYDEDKMFHFVLHEAVFYVTHSAKVMAAQARKIMHLALLSNVQIDVIPLGTSVPCVPIQNVVLIDGVFASIEIALARFGIASQRFIVPTKKMFDSAAEHSLKGNDAIAALQSIAEDFESRCNPRDAITLDDVSSSAR